MRHVRTLVAGGLIAAVVLVAAAAPAGAQQLVDAGGPNGAGGLAFVLFAAMAMIIAASLFYMDRIRRRRSQDPDE
jgi:hypothetical protein